MCNLLGVLGCKFIEPINELGIAATIANETSSDIAAIPPALLTTDAQHFELAGEIANRLRRRGALASRRTLKINTQYPGNDCGGN